MEDKQQAFIILDSRQHAEEAVDKLDGMMYRDSRIKVSGSAIKQKALLLPTVYSTSFLAYRFLESLPTNTPSPLYLTPHFRSISPRASSKKAQSAGTPSQATRT